MVGILNQSLAFASSLFTAFSEYLCAMDHNTHQLTYYNSTKRMEPHQTNYLSTDIIDHHQPVLVFVLWTGHFPPLSSVKLWCIWVLDICVSIPLQSSVLSLCEDLLTASDLACRVSAARVKRE